MPTAPEQSTDQVWERGELSARLRNVVAAHLHLDPGDIKDHHDLGEDLCMDSLAAAELLVVIEDDLGIYLPANTLAGKENVTYGQLDEIVAEHVDKQA